MVVAYAFKMAREQADRLDPAEQKSRLCFGDPLAATLTITPEEVRQVDGALASASQQAQPQPPVYDPSRGPPSGVPLPDYDVEANCRTQPGPFHVCRNREQSAYNALKFLWPQLHSWQTRCISLNQGIKMYQTLEMCVMDALHAQQAGDEVHSSQPFRRGAPERTL
jgi:hypothetical protein